MTVAGIFLVLVSVALVAAFAACAVRLAGVRDAAGRVVAFLIAGAAEIVLLAELLSLVRAFTVPGMLFGLAAAAGGAIWLVERHDPAGRERLRDWRPRLPSLSAGRVGTSIKQSPELAAAFTLVGALMAIEVVLAIGVAPNTYDSLTYHLTRAAYWIQNHSVTQFANATDRQGTYPINAEVLQAWVMMMSRGDRLVQLVQFVSQIGALAGVYGLARFLDFDRVPAVIATAVAACFPVMITQSTSTQNDLVLSFFIVATMLFTLRALHSNSTADLALAATAFGLAFGTKFNAVAMIPILGLVIAYHLRDRWRVIRHYVAVFAIGAFVFGTFNYAQNVFDGKGLTGSGKDDYLRVQSISELPKNTLRMVWASTFDLPHTKTDGLDRTVEKAGHSLFGFAETEGVVGFDQWFPRINHDAREDFVGFGPLALLALFPALLIGLIRFRHRERFLVAGCSVLLFLAVSCSLRYNTWILRFLLPSALLAAPLIASIAARRAGRVYLLLVAAFAAYPLALHNSNKPLTAENGVKAILSQTRNEQMSPGSIDDFVRVIDAVNLQVPVDGRLGFIGEPDTALEYPHFGPNLKRHLVKLTPEDLQPGVIERLNLNGILIADPTVGTPALPGLQMIDDGHTLVLPSGGT